MNEKDIMIEVNHMSHIYTDENGNDVHALNDVNLSIKRGEFVCIIGTNGSGKSTLLKLCSDLISPTSGRIAYEGQDIQKIIPEVYRQSVGYCFQRPYLFAKTVRRNILFPYDIRNMKPDMARIEYLFDLLQMPMDYFNRRNDELSGGEMQRICLIRSLIFEPKILLLDEVTSALDAKNTIVVEGLIEELHKHGVTIVSITHNEDQSLRHANRRITIVDGAIQQEEVLR